MSWVRAGQRSANAYPTPRIVCTNAGWEGSSSIFSRRELLELLRDYEALDQDEKTINVHVSHLREKIEDDPSMPQFVLTVRGAGYQFAEH